jgi:hypothetical protein
MEKRESTLARVGKAEGRKEGGVECWIDHEVKRWESYKQRMRGGSAKNGMQRMACKAWPATPMVKRTWFRVLFRSAKWR